MVRSNITWTDSTWNPWVGCRKVSDACKFCYMHRILDGKGSNPSSVHRTGKAFNFPLREREGKRIFTCSMSDFFIEEADKWRADAWEIIKNTPHHTYQILTKRPERIQECLPSDWSEENYSNVWLGVTVENQEAVHRIYELSKIKCELRFVSFEPLLGEIYLTKEQLSLFQWAIIGGESGSLKGKYKFRKTELGWYLSLMYQIRDSGTALFFKQFGSWYHHNGFRLKHWHGESWCRNFPEVFKIREFPVKKEGGGYGI